MLLSELLIRLWAYFFPKAKTPAVTPLLQHKHVLIRAEINKPPGRNDIDKTEAWFRDLIVNRLNMKILHGPVAKYVSVEGNAGMTGVAIIETSHVACHWWDEVSPAIMQLDVYTCGEMDPTWVFDAIKCFDPVVIEFKFLDREFGFKQLSSGVFYP
jgi:S-adenosylmethionine/arginine decarboxylase-like enzyme